MSIIGIMLAVAGPQFGSFSDNSKIRTSSRDFQSFILLARTEAVTRGSFINLVSTEDDNWGGEILMCATNTGPTTACTAATAIQIANFGNDEVAIKSSNNGDPIISFNSRGRLSGATSATTVELAFCDQRGTEAGDKAKILTINVTGRPNIEGLDVLQGHSCDPA